MIWDCIQLVLSEIRFDIKVFLVLNGTYWYFVAKVMHSFNIRSVKTEATSELNVPLAKEPPAEKSKRSTPLERSWECTCVKCKMNNTFSFMSQCLKVNSCLTDYKAFQRKNVFMFIGSFTRKISHGFKSTITEDAHSAKEWVEAGGIVLGCKICGLCKIDRAHFCCQVFLLHILEVSPVQICKCWNRR